MIYDCIIVGGGPAGLNAALVLGRTRRKVALIDNNQPRNAVTHASHGFITRDGVTPAEFRRIAYEEVLRYPSVEHIQTEIISINKNDSGFAVLDSFGRHIEARRLILATGLKEVLPEIEALRPLYGKVCLIARIVTAGNYEINPLSLFPKIHMFFIWQKCCSIGVKIWLSARTTRHSFQMNRKKS